MTDEMLWAIAVRGEGGQTAEMVKARNRLPDTVFIAPPSFLIGRRRKAVYDTSTIASFSFVEFLQWVSL